MGNFGVCYYPEHWDEERIETDISLMKDIGISYVRLAEFSWHKMEPIEGQYDFKWLNDVVDKFADAGISCIIGTPTAAPPAWLMNKHPEIFPVNDMGVRVTFNGRHHDCQSNKTYREYVKKIVTEMAKEFGHNENVAGWQIDNEFGNGHGDLCYCDSCRQAFIEWLEEKYKTVDNLNKAWGCAFWSQEYNDFSEVFLPAHTAAGKNPSTELDFKRFCSDLIVDFSKAQIDIIRQYSENQFITHNCMGFADKVNYYDLAADLDFVCHDQYPGGFYLQMPHEDNAFLAQTLELMRSFKNKNFWIMEQQAGPTGWNIMGRTPAPGQLSLWTAQAIAHGADKITYFRWRTATFGTEQYWHGILPHSGKPGRRYDEIKYTINRYDELLDEIKDLESDAKVAIVYSYDNYHALNIQPHNPDLSYVGVLADYYRALYDLKIEADMVSEMADFSKYKLVIAPLQYILKPEVKEHFDEYVKNGGHMCFTYRSGVKDENNICVSDCELPGLLSEMTGIEINDYDCLRETEVTIDLGQYSGKGKLFADIITTKEAERVGVYTNNYYSGETAISVNDYGKGLVYYIGCELDDNLLNKLIYSMLLQAKIEVKYKELDRGIEVVTRKGKDKTYIFFLNHNNYVAKLNKELIEGIEVMIGEKNGLLEPFGTAVYVKEK